MLYVIATCKPLFFLVFFNFFFKIKIWVKNWVATKMKKNVKGELQRYKVRLVAKSYKQRKVIDYKEVFAFVA